jgi:hypothetical protein
MNTFERWVIQNPPVAAPRSCHVEPINGDPSQPRGRRVEVVDARALDHQRGPVARDDVVAAVRRVLIDADVDELRAVYRERADGSTVDALAERVADRLRGAV